MPAAANDAVQTNDSFILRDLTAGLVVFLVALPLCLGIALASGAPLFSGLLAGIIGGLIVGSLSGSQTSVSGPAAGLTAIVAAQLEVLGSFEAFLFAVFVGGLLQIGLGISRAGALSAFFPTSVIKGLLAAIGVILILKQIPHVFGHDTDPEGEMSFSQPDEHNSISELGTLFAGEIHYGAALVGVTSVLLLVGWGRVKFLRESLVPGPLIIVLFGVLARAFLQGFGENWAIGTSHLVQIPVAATTAEFWSFFRFPDFSQVVNPAAYLGAVTIAVVASLETLLNLEAVDKLDTEKRHSPPSRELIAQGVGNTVAGLIGGLPVTSVIVRSSVNVGLGVKTKLSTIFHGLLLLVCVALFPVYLNKIPLAALAAILLVTGFKLANPALFKQMWNEGRYQFLPFIVTLLAIVFTDLLIGILIGLIIAILFVLNSNLRRPIRQIRETHIGGDVLRIELADQVSFLNRAALDTVFNDAKKGDNILIDASNSDYIDPDVLGMIRSFKKELAPARGITVSLNGFRKKYDLHDEIEFVDYSSRELKDQISADQVLDILKEGNRRFCSGHQLRRDFRRQIDATAGGQNPIAAVLSCIDSRVPAELVFDLGIGDIFSIRVAGNIAGTKSLGSMEYAVVVTGVKLVVVLGHTRCGAVTASTQLLATGANVQEATGCDHIHAIVDEIAPSVRDMTPQEWEQMPAAEQEAIVDDITIKNVQHTVQEIVNRSSSIRQAVESGKAKVVGAVYDVKSGQINFLD